MGAFAIAAAVFPALLLLWYFHSRDVHPEPSRVVWTTFILGICTIPFILMFGLPVMHSLEAIRSPFGYGLADAFLCAALPEELFKFLVLYFYSARHKEFNEPMDGIVYGVAASLGFATLENVLYVGSGGMGVALLRALTAVPGHAFTGAVMGYYVGRARFAPAGEPRQLWLALLVPMLLHGLYDFPLLVLKRFQELAPGTSLPGELLLLVPGTFVVLFVEYRLARRYVHQLRTAQQAMLAKQLPGHAPALTVVPAVAPVVVSAPAAVAASGAAAPSVILAWFLLLLGGCMVTGGGGLVLLLIIGFWVQQQSGQLGTLLLVTLLFGLPPLLIGARLYRLGIVRLNRAKPAPPGPRLQWS